MPIYKAAKSDTIPSRKYSGMRPSGFPVRISSTGSEHSIVWIRLPRSTQGTSAFYAVAAMEVIRVRVIPLPDHLSLTTVRDQGGMLTGSSAGIRRVEGSRFREECPFRPSGCQEYSAAE